MLGHGLVSALEGCGLCPTILERPLLNPGQILVKFNSQRKNGVREPEANAGMKLLHLPVLVMS